MANAREKVGIIGVGRMGLPMVKHMIAKGYDVTAVDASAENLGKAMETQIRANFPPYARAQ